MYYLVTAFAAALTASTLSGNLGRGVLSGLGRACLRTVSRLLCLRMVVQAIEATDSLDMDCHIYSADIEIRVRKRRSDRVPPA
ncbi:hypothetical protein [Amycolatopsis sp. WAC 04169]|uniref:hypothetical protein n=1 Tax=Amycolatopsis sp. WAC 04169 TaxID=2203197 RepID=UPI0013154227|nr:hypothetical protein [Amycolatopsis sp. WAC 04169]